MLFYFLAHIISTEKTMPTNTSELNDAKKLALSDPSPDPRKCFAVASLAKDVNEIQSSAWNLVGRRAHNPNISLKDVDPTIRRIIPQIEASFGSVILG